MSKRGCGSGSWVEKSAWLRLLVLVTVTGLLLALWPTHSYAQQALSSETTRKWVEGKMNDPARGAAIKDLSAVIHDKCDPRKSSRSFDPVPCWNKQLDASKLLLAEAGNDPRTSPTVHAAIRKQASSLDQEMKRWNELPEKIKSERLKTLANLMASVEKTGHQDLREALKQISADPEQDKHTREIAKRTLIRPWGNRCILGCVCGHQEGCPCCGYEDIIRNMLLTQ
jgi:hypothetical protein